MSDRESDKETSGSNHHVGDLPPPPVRLLLERWFNRLKLWQQIPVAVLMVLGVIVGVPMLALYWILFVPNRMGLWDSNTPTEYKKSTPWTVFRRVLNVFLWGGVLFLLGLYAGGFSNFISSLLPVSLERLATALNFAWAGKLAVPALLASAGVVFAALGQLVARYWFHVLIEPGRYVENEHKLAAGLVNKRPQEFPRSRLTQAAVFVNPILWGALLSGVTALLVALSPLQAWVWLGAVIGGAVGFLGAVAGQLWVVRQNRIGLEPSTEVDFQNRYVRLRFIFVSLLFNPHALAVRRGRVVHVLSIGAWGGILAGLAYLPGISSIATPLIFFIVGVGISGLVQLVDYFVGRYIVAKDTQEAENAKAQGLDASPSNLPVLLAYFFHGLVVNPVLYSDVRQLSSVKTTALFVAHTLIWGSIVALSAVELLGNIFGATGAGIIFGLLGSVVTAGVQYSRYRGAAWEAEEFHLRDDPEKISWAQSDTLVRAHRLALYSPWREGITPSHNSAGQGCLSTLFGRSGRREDVVDQDDAAYSDESRSSDDSSYHSQ